MEREVDGLGEDLGHSGGLGQWSVLCVGITMDESNYLDAVIVRFQDLLHIDQAAESVLPGLRVLL